jgi:hypothetical protein
VQAEFESLGDIVISRFIASTFSSVFWYPPALEMFLGLNVPATGPWTTSCEAIRERLCRLLRTHQCPRRSMAHVIPYSGRSRFHSRDHTRAVVPGTHARALSVALHGPDTTRLSPSPKPCLLLNTCTTLCLKHEKACNPISQRDFLGCDYSITRISVPGETSVPLQESLLYQQRLLWCCE